MSVQVLEGQAAATGRAAGATSSGGAGSAYWSCSTWSASIPCWRCTRGELGLQWAVALVPNARHGFRRHRSSLPAPPPLWHPIAFFHLCCSAYSPEAYRQLRDCTIAEAATAFAAAQRWEELGVLLARHPYALLPAMLDALAAAPETADPKRLVPLLQQLAQLREAARLARQPDWVESDSTVEDLRREDAYALLLATEPLAALSVGWRPPSARRLAAWICERALALDATTGQLNAAIALLEAGRAVLHYSEASLSTLLGAAQELALLLKLAASRGEAAVGADDGAGDASAGVAGADEVAAASAPAWRLTLRRYSALEPPERLVALLELVGTDTLAADLGGVVAPFLSRMEGVDTGLLLRQVMSYRGRALPEGKDVAC